MQIKPVPLDAIRTDGGTQSRMGLNNETVQEYGAALESGAEFPPIVLFHDGSDYWLADGFHRFHGHRSVGRVSVTAEVHQGTQRDALLHSIGANASHGLRRTNADKRRAVQMLLNDMDWCRWPENRIALHCNVSRSLVRSVMDEVHPAEKQDAVVEVVRNGKTYTQDTSGIKAKAKPPKAVDEVKAPVEQPAPPEPIEDESAEIVRVLVEENQTLSQRLAVAAMDATEEERAAASDLITQLRNEVAAIKAERDALAAGRDAAQNEIIQLKRQIAFWRKKAEQHERTEAA